MSKQLPCQNQIETFQTSYKVTVEYLLLILCPGMSDKVFFELL